MPTTPSMTRSVAAETLDEATPGFGERRQRLAMRAVRVEQHRVGGGAAASQERRRPQRVATVVAGSDDRAHPAADHPTRASGQLTADLGGQPEGRASHQRTVGQAGQQGRLSRADGVDRVVVAHLRPAVLGCRACAADFDSGRIPQPTVAFPGHRIEQQTNQDGREVTDRGEVQLGFVHRDQRKTKDDQQHPEIAPAPRFGDVIGQYRHHTDQEVADPDITSVHHPFGGVSVLDRQIEQAFAQIGGTDVSGQSHGEPTQVAEPMLGGR